jgi:ketosteroid isomerase-like protein/quercetin dioxygenase-like cupin family protein
MHRGVIVLALGALLSGGCGTSVNVEAEREALLAQDRAWSAASSDLDKFVSYFAADAAFYPPGMPVMTGTDAIRKAHGAMLAMPGFSVKWAPASAVVGAAGDIGQTAGSYEATIGGVVERGKYVTTWRKDAGQWKVTADIFNADAAPAAQHAVVAPATLKWGEAPPGLPPGARVAVVTGDPTQPVPFVLRAQMPAGYTIQPHWHPTAENVTVLSGTVAVGMGEKFDKAAMQELAAGGYAVLPAEMRHSFMARTAATIQVHGVGPFAITYVNAADDPRNKK